jgi:hypothetical protein
MIVRKNKIIEILSNQTVAEGNEFPKDGLENVG